MARSPVAVARTSKGLLAGAHDDGKLRLLPGSRAGLGERASKVTVGSAELGATGSRALKGKTRVPRGRYS